MLTAGLLLHLNNIKIRVNIWKTEAQDASLDRILNQVSRGLTGDVNLNGTQPICHGSKAVQCEGCLSQSWDPVAIHNSVNEGRGYKMCPIYLLGPLIPLSPLSKSTMLFLTKMQKIEHNYISYNQLRKIKHEKYKSQVINKDMDEVKVQTCLPGNVTQRELV